MTKQPITLYAIPVSGYCAKVRIALEQKGVSYLEVEPPHGYRSSAYRAIAPMGTVPALLVDDDVLSESEVILEYLEEQYPDPAMLPDGALARARVRFLGRFHDLRLEPAVRALFGHVDPTRREQKTVDTRAQEIAANLEQLESFLGPGPFAVTPMLSLADCGYAATLPLANMLLRATGSELTNGSNSQKLGRWLDNLAAHPAVSRALAPWRAATAAWIDTQLNSADKPAG